MPIDWDELDGAIDAALEKSTEATDAQLASRISSVTRMTDEEVQALFPDPADVKRLADLMKVVKSAEDRNKKVNYLIANADKLGGVVVKLLEKFT